MAFDTNISNLHSLPFPEESTRAIDIIDDVASRDLQRTPARPLPHAVSANSTPEGIASWSGLAQANSMPESLVTSWSRIAQANMSVQMYRRLVQIAMQPPGWHGPGSLDLRPASLRNFFAILVNDSRYRR